MFKSLTTPRLPAAAITFPNQAITLLELNRRGKSFSVKRGATTRLNALVFKPTFDQPNILDESAMIQMLNQTAQQAGLLRQRKWSAALPEAAIRSAVAAIESAPKSRAELQEVINWKAERLVGFPADELRLSYQKLSSLEGHHRFLIIAVKREILEQYERVLAALGWQVGFILPQHLAEAQMLNWLGAAETNLMVSSNEQGFSLVILRANEPLLIRSVECEPEACSDELFRLTQYYRDKLSGGEATAISNLLLVGEASYLSEVKQVIGEALEQSHFAPNIIDANRNALEFSGSGASFNQIAAAAGLASSAWL